jgi:orotidine-5'-phosphate decarboxylase
MVSPSPRDRLIVALDFPAVAQAEAMVARLGPAVTFYKVGLQLILAPRGISFAERLAKSGKRVFVDAKLLDIDNTVAGAVASIGATGASFATVHAYPNAMRAAVAARGRTSLKILAVTVLTSMNDADLAEAGYAETAADLVVRRAEQAAALGVDGIVASPAEVAAIRARVGASLIVVTPGVRSRWTSADDQKRVAVPGAAIAAGADYLVVGRPITEASDPLLSANAIVAEIEQAASAMAGRAG